MGKIRVEYQVYCLGKRIGFIFSDGINFKFVSETDTIKALSNNADIGITRNFRGFKLTDGRKLSDIPKIEYKELSKLNNMHYIKGVTYFTGNKLLDFIDASIDNNWIERDIVGTISDYFISPYKGMMLAISGLRGTGKTVAILHALRLISKPSESMYITISEDSKIDCNQLCDYIQNKLYGIKYLVIDEATRLIDIVKYGDIIFDRLKSSGIAVVMSGTDTLALACSQNSGLYHRILEKNITFISLDEYARTLGIGLKQNETLQSYIKMGGLYTPQKITDFNSFIRYIDTAIIDNILNTVSKNKDVSGLMNIQHMTKEKLRSIVFKVIYSISYRNILASETASPIRHKFKKVSNSIDLHIEELCNSDYVDTSVCKALGIDRVVKASSHEINEVLTYLLILGIVVDIKNLADNSSFYHFVNPSIINQAYSSVYNAIYNELGIDGSEIGIKTMKSVYGQIFESMIINHVIVYANKYGLNTAVFRNKQGREIDLIVYTDEFDWIDAKCIYYEIKLTSDLDSAMSRVRWLNDKTYRPGETYIPTDDCRDIQRYVIYTGKPCIFDNFNNAESVHITYSGESMESIRERNKGTRLIQAYDFMTQIDKYLSTLRIKDED